MTGQAVPTGHDRPVTDPRLPAVSGAIRVRATGQSYHLTGHPVILKGVSL